MLTTDLSVEELSQRCAEETGKYRHRQGHDPRFCFELFRRALAQSIPEAFTKIFRIFEPQVRTWVYYHSGFADTSESAEYFVSSAFANFYFALRGHKIDRFATLAHLLAYLKTCVHTSIAQYLRAQPPISVAPLEDSSHSGYTPDIDENLRASELWTHICHVLPDEVDQQLARHVFMEDMKPAQVARVHPEHWHNAREVSVALQRIRRNLRKDDTLRRWAGLEHEDD